MLGSAKVDRTGMHQMVPGHVESHPMTHNPHNLQGRVDMALKPQKNGSDGTAYGDLNASQPASSKPSVICNEVSDSAAP